MFDFSNTTNSLEESVNNLEEVANFFKPENLSNLFNQLLIYIVIGIILIIIIKIVVGYFMDKRRAKMIAKEVIKELEANGYPTKKTTPSSTIE